MLSCPQITAALGLWCRMCTHCGQSLGGNKVGRCFKVLLQVPCCFWGAAHSPVHPVAPPGHSGSPGALSHPIPGPEAEPSALQQLYSAGGDRLGLVTPSGWSLLSPWGGGL